jgi:sugar phosphate isomerase/epimerase
MFHAGIASWTCETDGTLEALRRIGRHGFRDVELWCNYAHLDPRLGEDVRRVQEVLSQEGLRAVSLHAPYEFRGKQFSEEAAWAAWEQLMIPLLETAELLQVSLVVVHPALLCFPSNPTESTPMVTGCQEESLIRVIRLAGKKGIKIALENMGRKTVPTFADLCKLVELVDRLGEDNVGICFDTGHCLISGLDPMQEVEQCASKLCSFHLHENDRVEDLHWVPGRGAIDWPRFFEKLRTLDYRGPLILEIWGGRHADATMDDARGFVERHHLGADAR